MKRQCSTLSLQRLSQIKPGCQAITLSKGFTIVELLVVIVVIGILAAITVVSYNGISQKAKEASLQSDLDNASKQLKIFQVSDASGNYPTTIDCGRPDSGTNKCIKASNDNIYTYTPSNGTNPKTLALKAANGTTDYHVTENSSPFTLNPTDWLTIGTQTWARANLNVGTMVTGAGCRPLGTKCTIYQTNSTLEKYCYNNTESNCTTYGGLYQWNEAMQYVTTEGAQGICPAGSHIPTDAEWTTLVTYLGGPTVAGAKLKSGGSSGLDMPLAGYNYTGDGRNPPGDGYYIGDGYFDDLSSDAYLWSSSEFEFPTNALTLDLPSDNATAYSFAGGKANGFSVRCLGN